MGILGKCGAAFVIQGVSVLRAHAAGSVGCVSGRIISLTIKYITGTAHLSPLSSSKIICLLPLIPKSLSPTCYSSKTTKIFFSPLLVSFCIGHSLIKKLLYCFTNTFNHLSPDGFDGVTEMFLI